MGQYLLGGTISKNPYTTKELNTHIYTAEELCYYIVNNLSILEEKFIQEDLLEFIRTELDMAGLSERIRRYYHSEKDRDMILIMILRDVGYYNEVEIAEFQSNVSKIRHMSPIEKRRIRGNLFVEKKYYTKALNIYQNIIKDIRNMEIQGSFCAEIYQHIGVCYANLFQYDLAMNYMQRAYGEEKSRELQKQIYFLSRLQKKIIPRELQDVDENTFKKWEREYTDTERKIRMKIQNGEIASIYELDEEQWEKTLSDYLKERKREYRKMASNGILL